MTLDIRTLTNNLSVAPQITLDDIQTIKDAGYKSILNNRPDAEQEDQPEQALIKAAALDAGLNYIYQPVNGSAMNDQDVSDFKHHLSTLEGPVLAHCRTGTRCTVLWVRSQKNEQTADNLIATAAQAGYNMEAQRAYLAN